MHEFHLLTVIILFLELSYHLGRLYVNFLAEHVIQTELNACHAIRIKILQDKIYMIHKRRIALTNAWRINFNKILSVFCAIQSAFNAHYLPIIVLDAMLEHISIIMNVYLLALNF